MAKEIELQTKACEDFPFETQQALTHGVGIHEIGMPTVTGGLVNIVS